MKRIVVIGGGNGSAISINALKQIDDLQIDAVISTTDSGGSSGRLRKEFNTLPTGDVMRAALALSLHPFESLKQIFYRERFEDVGKLNKHNLGNLFLVLAEQYEGDFMKALRAFEQALGTFGHVYPVLLEQADIFAELEDGTVLETEHAIDRPDRKRNGGIKRLWVEPAHKVNPEAAEIIKNADVIVLGPGSLFCSVIANLVVPGVKEAIDASKARLVFVPGNAYELEGEHGPTSLSGSIKALESYLPRELYAVVYNNHEFSEEEKQTYASRNWATIDVDIDACPERNIVVGDYERVGGGLDATKLSPLLKNVL